MRERRKLSPQVNIILTSKSFVYGFTHHILHPPATEILKEGLPFLCRAEEMVSVFSRFDMNNGNIQGFFKQIQQIATSYPTPTASNKHTGVGDARGRNSEGSGKNGSWPNLKVLIMPSCHVPCWHTIQGSSGKQRRSSREKHSLNQERLSRFPEISGC